MKPRSAVRFLALILIVLSGLRSSAQNNPQTIEFARTRMQIVWYAPNIVQIRITPGQTFSNRPSLSVVATSGRVDVKRRESKSSVELATNEMTLRISKGNGKLEFRDPRGRFLLAQESNEASFVQAKDQEGYHVRQIFEISEQEGLYGLGQMEDPVVNYRGQDLLLTQANRTAINPFLVSTRGYGILWDNYSRTRFSDTKAGACFSSEVSDDIDYYVVYGPHLDRVVAGYRLLTGKAPLFGKWAYGYWQSKERYKSSQELIAVVREYRDRQIPLDNIVQDWAYWGGNDQFSSMRWDSSAYPDPLGLSETLHQDHAHLMVSIWPAFGVSSAIYKEMDAKGLLYPEAHWNGGKVYDAYSPVARDIYWRYVKEGLFNAGVDAFWMDATEPEFRCTDDRYITEISLKEAGRNDLGSFARYLTPYSLMTTRAIYENHRHATEKKRVFILTRSSFAGQQRYG
ncbi:MAG TPA: TIM-barrel domain-containing protein, partial [Bacteroidota bacterium]|nr:TIM-barrel domain-containing protein [Bacteroidota bacterium]